MEINFFKMKVLFRLVALRSFMFSWPIVILGYVPEVRVGSAGGGFPFHSSIHFIHWQMVIYIRSKGMALLFFMSVIFLSL